MTQTDTERVSYNFDAIYNLQLALTSFLKGGSALELRLVIHLDSKYHRFLSRWTQFAAILVAFRHQIHIQTLYVIPIQYMFQIFRRVASDMLFYGSKTPTRVGKKQKKSSAHRWSVKWSSERLHNSQKSSPASPLCSAKKNAIFVGQIMVIFLDDLLLRVGWKRRFVVFSEVSWSFWWYLLWYLVWYLMWSLKIQPIYA